MIKIAHESPKSIFETVQQYTDYDYALVHLFAEDYEYYDLFYDAIEKGREVILDNSIFELGNAFDSEAFAWWIKKLNPTWYIVPDVLEDSVKTMASIDMWNSKYSDIKSKKIGVVQGKTYKQIVECYQHMDKKANVDMIAISFDYSYYTQSVPHPNKYVSWMLGRVKLLGDLLKDGVINVDKPHHLLGNSLYWEGQFYKHSDYSWIYSMDTSNPVVFGIKGKEYEGLTFGKPTQKLFTLINDELDEIQMKKVFNNIKDFRKAWNG